MIITPLKHISRFMGISPNLDIAFQYLAQLKLPDVVPTKEPVDLSDGVKVNVFDYQPSQTNPGSQLEGHQKWMDIHLVASGAEQMAVGSADAVKQTVDYEADKDIAFYEGQPEAVVNLYPGDVLVTFPEDFHQPGIKANDLPVRKVLIKVKVDF